MTGKTFKPTHHRIITSEEASDGLRDEVQMALANPNEIFGYSRYGDGTAWSKLDRLTGGIQKLKIAFVAARPKVGKSMLLSSLIPHIARQAKAAGQVLRLVTLEMKVETYQRRIASIMAKIRDPMNIRRGFISDEEEDRYLTALAELSALPIEYLSAEEDMTEEQTYIPGGSDIMFEDIARFISGGKTFWWGLDHIGLIGNIANATDTTRGTWLMANKLKALAHTVCAGLVVSHLVRGSDAYLPSIDTLANSDQVVRIADQIFLVSRPFFQNSKLSDEVRALVDAMPVEPAYLQVQTRDEGAGQIKMVWNKALATFEEGDWELPAAVTNTRRRSRSG